MWTHKFGADTGMKNLNIEVAIALWEMFLGSKCGFLQSWCAFIRGKAESAGLKVVTSDVWSQFIGLQEQTQGDIKKFEDDGCWPPLFDEYFETL